MAIEKNTFTLLDLRQLVIGSSLDKDVMLLLEPSHCNSVAYVRMSNLSRSLSIQLSTEEVEALHGALGVLLEGRT